MRAPSGSTTQEAALAKKLMPPDATTVASWLVPYQHPNTTQFWFKGFNASSLRAAGSKTSRVPPCALGGSSQGGMTGVSEDDTIAFGQRVLPRGARRETAFEALQTEAGRHGWGTSTWRLLDGAPTLLFSHCVQIGSGEVARETATAALAMNQPQAIAG